MKNSGTFYETLNNLNVDMIFIKEMVAYMLAKQVKSSSELKQEREAILENVMPKINGYLQKYANMGNQQILDKELERCKSNLQSILAAATAYLDNESL